MNNKKNIIIGVLLGIVILLLIFVVLLISGTISFKNESVGNVSNSNNVEKLEDKSDDVTNDDNKNTVSDNNKNIVSDDEKYSSIIDEYRKVIGDTEKNIDNYSHVNKTIVHYYFSYNKVKFNYAFYDIDNNGSKELLISDNGYDGTHRLVDLYSYDGNNAIKLFTDICLGDRCSVNLYDSGIMFFYGSGGASRHSLEFYKLGSNGYNKESIASYGVEIDDNNNVTVMEGNTKTNYTSDDDVINHFVGSAKKVDLSSLNWNVIG